MFFAYPVIHSRIEKVFSNAYFSFSDVNNATNRSISLAAAAVVVVVVVATFNLQQNHWKNERNW